VKLRELGNWEIAYRNSEKVYFNLPHTNRVHQFRSLFPPPETEERSFGQSNSTRESEGTNIFQNRKEEVLVNEVLNPS
jgi:hypothetical protein